MPYEHQKIDPDSNGVIALPDGYTWVVTEDSGEIVIAELPPGFYDIDTEGLNDRITRVEHEVDQHLDLFNKMILHAGVAMIVIGVTMILVAVL